MVVRSPDGHLRYRRRSSAVFPHSRVRRTTVSALLRLSALKLPQLLVFDDTHVVRNASVVIVGFVYHRHIALLQLWPPRLAPQDAYRRLRPALFSSKYMLIVSKLCTVLVLTLTVLQSLQRWWSVVSPIFDAILSEYLSDKVG